MFGIFTAVAIGSYSSFTQLALQDRILQDASAMTCKGDVRLSIGTVRVSNSQVCLELALCQCHCEFFITAIDQSHRRHNFADLHRPT